MRRRLSIPLCCTPVVALLVAPLASGAIINGGNGTQNTTAPAGLTNWGNVGYFPSGNDSGGSGVYLGNGWVLTAAHVQGGRDWTFPIVFRGVNGGQDATFWSQAGVYRQLRAPSDAAPSDVTVFRLQDDALLQTLPTVRFGGTPAVGTGITVVGESFNRAPDLHYWRLSDAAHPERASWTDVTGQPNQGTAQRRGYYYDTSGHAKRWGTNTTIALEGSSPTTDFQVKDAAGNVTQSTRLIGAMFDDLANEAQVAPGDSGGGVFAGNRLVGINLYLGDYRYPSSPNPQNLGQPANTAVFGNTSYYVDLFSYVDQIASITGVHPGIDGDANLDGFVNDADFQTLRRNFQTGTFWTQGDFNLDGIVNFTDFQILERNFGKNDFGIASEPTTAPALVGVPEPGVAVLAGAAMFSLARRRRRRRSDESVKG